MFLCIQPIFYSTSVSSVTFWSTIKKKGHRSGFFATRGLNVQPRQAGSSLRAGFLRNNTALLYISKVRILLQVAMATGRMWRNPMLFNHVPGSGLKLSLFFNCVFIPWERCVWIHQAVVSIIARENSTTFVVTLVSLCGKGQVVWSSFHQGRRLHCKKHSLEWQKK